MKKFTVRLAILMIAMMMGGSAWAFNETDHVKVAPNGKGDLLIFPYYYAYPGDYSTKITVINTSNDRSVVAKVVYRSFIWSAEVLDHLIYLSPSDVWTGYLVNEDGVAYLWSDDDSILGKTPTYPATADAFANITPVYEPFKTEKLCTGDVNTFGYIEIIEAASRLESVETTGYAPGTRVAKWHIWDWYEKEVDATSIINTYPPANVLTGYQENSFGAGWTLKQANVFAGYKNETKLIVNADTWLGALANNTLSELEAAMAKEDVALPYVAKQNGDYSVHIFNFPTKLSRFNGCSYRAYEDSPYWVAVGGMCERYEMEIYDLLENKVTSEVTPFSPYGTRTSTMCNEVEFSIQGYSNPAFTEGWIRYNWDLSDDYKFGITRSQAPISYTGTPVLPSVLRWASDRSYPAEATAAYSDGIVEVRDLEIPFYQYSDRERDMK